jgi:uncharacterized protein YcnI
MVVTMASAVVLLAGTAGAHVTVNPRTAQQGSFAKLSFRVPNERDDADTTGLEVQLPTDHPLASVSIEPKDGWTYEVTKAPLPTPVSTDDGELTEAVSTITWSGGSLKPGEFTEFDVSVGPLPDAADSLTFKALQTYSDGEVVRWIETAEPGQAEPEHPAPVLVLAPASESADAAGGGSSDSSDSSDTVARTLGIIGIVIGVIGIGVAGYALTRRGAERPPTAPPPSAAA